MRRLVSKLVTFLLGFSFASLALAQASPKLREDEAKLRKSLITDLSYKVNLKLSESDPEYHGLMTILFHMTDQQPLRIDFSQGKVESLSDRNGKAVPFQYDGEAIRLAKDALKRGPNEFRIRYSAPYSNGRFGLFRYKDSLDGKVYVFSDFQPYDANRLYPLFDQPDLRAPMTLEVEVPESWQVVSTTMETSVAKAGTKGRSVWTFPATPALAPYLYSLHAGPFHVWKDPLSRLPSRLFGRASQARQVRYEEWFQYTRHALEFFEQLTGIPYPFGKMDQMLVPEFRGGMENVAAITYSEGFINPGVRTRIEQLITASVIMHELAHMWFGNLVTTSWWDNLWLNESFASYMESLAMADHPEFRDYWEDVHTMKTKGLRADAYPTTHPIVQAVPDTNSTNFDRITYNKGAAFLRVFHQRVGDVNFRKGLNLYLKTHAYGNATIEDWVKAFEKASGKPLKDFVDSWTLTAGSNTLEAAKVCSKDGRLEKLTVVQTAPEAHPTLRTRSNTIDLYSIRDGKATTYARLKADISGKTTDVPVNNLKCPDLVFLNADDSDFVHLNWNNGEKAFLLKYGERIAEPLLKLNMMSSLFTEAEQGRIPLQDYVTLLLRVIEQDQNRNVLDFARGSLSQMRNLYLYYVPDLEKRRNVASTSAQALERAFHTKGRSDGDRISIFAEMLSMLLLAENRQRLETLWEQSDRWKPALEHQGNRWTLLQSLQLLGSPKAKAWADQLKAQDQTSAGEKSYLAFEVMGWPYAKRAETVASIAAGKSAYSIADINSIMSAAFHPVRRQDMVRFLNESFLTTAQSASQNSSIFVALALVNNITPTLCDASDDARYEKVLTMSWTKNLLDTQRDQQETSRRCHRLRF